MRGRSALDGRLVIFNMCVEGQGELFFLEGTLF